MWRGQFHKGYSGTSLHRQMDSVLPVASWVNCSTTTQDFSALSEKFASTKKQKAEYMLQRNHSLFLLHSLTLRNQNFLCTVENRECNFGALKVKNSESSYSRRELNSNTHCTYERISCCLLAAVYKKFCSLIFTLASAFIAASNTYIPGNRGYEFICWLINWYYIN